MGALQRALHGLALAVCGLACTKPEAVRDLAKPAPRDAAFYRGISLGLFASTKDPIEQRVIYRGLLDELKEAGATDVQLVVEWTQHDVRASEIAAGASTPKDELLRAVVADAKERRLRVFLMPIIRLLHRQTKDWRGTLRPDDREGWWRAYRRFILHYAELSSEAQVELFAVGSELVSMENDEQRWRSLIAAVRERHRGRLTYSANWDHFEPIAFWDALDVMGVTAYQPLATDPSVRDDAILARGFLPFAARLSTFASMHDLRYIFTEVGYPSSAHAAVRPWDYRSGSVDLALQVACYRALFRAWHDDRRLAGLFFWNWFGFGGEEDAGYTPRKKPAAAVLRHWYRN